MSAIAVGPEQIPTPEQATETTLLELVRAVSEVARDEREVVAVVVDLLRSGHARLIGSFRGVSLEHLEGRTRE